MFIPHCSDTWAYTVKFKLHVYTKKSKAAMSMTSDLHCKAIDALFFIPYRTECKPVVHIAIMFDGEFSGST